MTKRFTKSFVVAAGLLAAPEVAGPLSAEINPDPRLERLREFLASKDSPVEELAGDFLEAADQNDLDWRLLPSISMVESSGGKYKKGNNIFGWANCEKRFPSVRHGIHLVARRLSESPHYRGKSTEGKLRVYNPRAEYALAVKRVMREIGPARLN
ncbi:MAG: hypothetical protein SFV18_03405 [Bryobacteraceae bacterium]|nr:hypothetical protein [Bryobacteraceae bacterium]